jgi:antitoxin (DNA-binding transcriptional repressor) of toxin-antitoxin stability system
MLYTQMREVRDMDLLALLSQVLEEVEHGETVVITRDGRPIARIVPQPGRRQRDIKAVITEIEEFRKTMPRIPLEEILSARHEGHKH